MKLKKLVATLSLATAAATASANALANPLAWPYDGESGHISLAYSDAADDITTFGLQAGYGNLTQSLGGWIWDASANYVLVDSAIGSEWGFGLSGELGYRFPNVIRGVDLDVLAGLAHLEETVELGGKGQLPHSIKLETIWGKLGVGFYAQATPTTDIRVEMGVMEALDISLESSSGSHRHRLDGSLDESEFRTLYAGLSARFANTARFPILASMTASRSDPYGHSNNALMFTIGIEF